MTGSAWPACPDCGGETVTILHEASPEARASNATLQCDECERVFKAVIETPSRVELACVVSEGATSRQVRVEVPGDEPVRVGDEVYGAETRLLITAVENQEGRRVRSAPPASVKTLWTKVYDTITVKVAVNRGMRTEPTEIEATPEEEFFIGDRITLTNGPVEVHAIKTDHGIRHRGGAQAKDVIRLYAHPPKEILSDVDDDVHRGAGPGGHGSRRGHGGSGERPANRDRGGRTRPGGQGGDRGRGGRGSRGGRGGGASRSPHERRRGGRR